MLFRYNVPLKRWNGYFESESYDLLCLKDNSDENSVLIKTDSYEKKGQEIFYDESTSVYEVISASDDGNLHARKLDLEELAKKDSFKPKNL